MFIKDVLIKYVDWILLQQTNKNKTGENSVAIYLVSMSFILPICCQRPLFTTHKYSCWLFMLWHICLTTEHYLSMATDMIRYEIGFITSVSIQKGLAYIDYSFCRDFFIIRPHYKNVVLLVNNEIGKTQVVVFNITQLIWLSFGQVRYLIAHERWECVINLLTKRSLNTAKTQNRLILLPFHWLYIK